MNISTLITGGDASARNAALEKLISGKKVAAYDIVRFVPQEGSESFKIDDVREFQRLLSGEPVDSDVRLGVISELGRATIEAQHALLKLLEEPPAHAVIVATVDRPSRLLATIQSRCRIIRIADEGFQLSPTEITTFQSQIETIFSGDWGRRLELAATVAKDKQSSIAWLKGSITALRSMLLAELPTANDGKRTASARGWSSFGRNGEWRITTIQKFSRALRALETSNVNPRLLVENLLLDLHR